MANVAMGKIVVRLIGKEFHAVCSKCRLFGSDDMKLDHKKGVVVCIKCGASRDYNDVIREGRAMGFEDENE